MLEICTLGTGGTLPIPERALSSLYVRENGQALLIDCGEGTQVGIRRLGWGFKCLEGLLLTHFHGDHCTGLAGLLLCHLLGVWWYARTAGPAFPAAALSVSIPFLPKDVASLVFALAFARLLEKRGVLR